MAIAGIPESVNSPFEVKPGDVLYMSFSDPNDPESPIEVCYVTGSGDEETWFDLAWTTPQTTREMFVWMVLAFAIALQIPVQNETGIEL